MKIGDVSRDLVLIDCIGTISYVKEHDYLGIMISNYGNHEAKIRELMKDEQPCQN